MLEDPLLEGFTVFINICCLKKSHSKFVVVVQLQQGLGRVSDTSLNPPSVVCYITLWYQSISKSHCSVLYLSIMQRTPLHIAVKKFRVKTAEFLADNNADINSQDNDGVSM